MNKFKKSVVKQLCILGKRRYNIKLWKTFTDCFNCLPVAAIVNEKIFCCHGGLSPDLQSMEQIQRKMRPTDVPDQGLLCDLLWSDPDKVNLRNLNNCSPLIAHVTRSNWIFGNWTQCPLTEIHGQKITQFHPGKLSF